MRIRARLVWIPLAITVAGVVYQSMVAMAGYQARQDWPSSVHETPKPFVLPPKLVSEPTFSLPAPPEPESSPVRPALPKIPGTELPPFHPHK